MGKMVLFQSWAFFKLDRCAEKQNGAFISLLCCPLLGTADVKMGEFSDQLVGPVSNRNYLDWGQLLKHIDFTYTIVYNLEYARRVQESSTEKFRIDAAYKRTV